MKTSSSSYSHLRVQSSANDDVEATAWKRKENELSARRRRRRIHFFLFAAAAIEGAI